MEKIWYILKTAGKTEETGKFGCRGPISCICRVFFICIFFEFGLGPFCALYYIFDGRIVRTPPTVFIRFQLNFMESM